MHQLEPYKLSLNELIPPKYTIYNSNKICAQVLDPPTVHVAKSTPESRITPHLSVQDIGLALWPLLTTSNQTNIRRMDMNGFVEIKIILQTPQCKALNITKLDILSICLCNSNKEFNKHLCFELDQTHQFIRHNNTVPNIIFNSPVSKAKRPLDITSPEKIQCVKPRYGPKQRLLYGPQSFE